MATHELTPDILQEHVEKPSLYFQDKIHQRIFSFSLLALHNDLHCLIPKILFTRNHKLLGNRNEEACQECVHCISKYEHQNLTITIKAPNSGRNVERRLEVGFRSLRGQKPIHSKTHFFLNLIIRWFFTSQKSEGDNLRIVPYVVILLGTFHPFMSHVRTTKFYTTTIITFVLCFLAFSCAKGDVFVKNLIYEEQRPVYFLRGETTLFFTDVE